LATVLVRGTGDIGSAVAHRLFQAGYAVMIHDMPQPSATRRGMALTDAVFDGRAALAGIEAVRLDDVDDIMDALATRFAVPVTVGDFSALVTAVGPDILVDGRMRKRSHPEAQRGLAKLTIGLGPNFIAGEITDVVIETSWGEALGRVLRHGASLPLAGEPRSLGGHTRDRYVYSPTAGIFRTTCQIGNAVRQGDLVAEVGWTTLTAPLDGVLRGLTRDGVPVLEGTKVIEVDPSGPAAEVRGIGERPRRIAEGVLTAIHDWLKEARP
jgi:xanthine dehydrogenase accessory factor